MLAKNRPSDGNSRVTSGARVQRLRPGLAFSFLVVALCAVVHARLTLAADFLIDDMEGDLSSWGKVTPETTIVKQGRQSLRWEPTTVGQAIKGMRVPKDLSHYRSFHAWVHSSNMTGARIRMTFLSPDAANGGLAHLKWKRVYEWEKIIGGMLPIPVKVDITGATRLRLFTTDAGDGINSDHAAWGAARVE